MESPIKLQPSFSHVVLCDKEMVPGEGVSGQNSFLALVILLSRMEINLFKRLPFRGGIVSTQLNGRQQTLTEPKLQTHRRIGQVTESLCASFLTILVDIALFQGSDELIRVNSLEQGLTPGKFTIHGIK